MKDDKHTAVIVKAMQQKGQSIFPTLMMLRDTAVSTPKNYLSIPFYYALTTLRDFAEYYGKDTSALPSEHDFLQAQIGLIDEQIADNVRRKDPGDRELTTKLRGMAKDYRRFLADL